MSNARLRSGSTQNTMKDVTGFQSKVYRATLRIPRGSVSTYGDVARAIGCGSPRAVGQALKVNPFAPKVPCHRVIASSLKIGGFQGKANGTAIRKKIALLKAEGVGFDRQGHLQNQEQLFRF